MIASLDHVVMFVPSVRAAAGWYSSGLQFADPLGKLFGLVGPHAGT
jgi:hypothetical protein